MLNLDYTEKLLGFPSADIIADKYHVVRQVTWAFENVRKRVQKNFSDSRRKYFKHSRRLLLKSVDKLTADEIIQVDNMIRLSKDLAAAYYLKNEFYKFMKSDDYETAKKRLSNWIFTAQISNISEFDKCTDTFFKWRSEILNAFKYGFTNGYTEGCNNKIKVLKRISYGIRNFERMKKRILHINYQAG